MAYKKIEQYDEVTTEGLKKNYKEAISFLGEDADREGLRHLNVWLKLCSLLHKVIS